MFGMLMTPGNAGFGKAPSDAAFDPASLFASSERGAFYDPSDLSTMFQDAAGTTPVTADGDPVGRIEDKSGNDNHATQSVAANRPIYKTSGGLHWLETDGAGDGLEIPGLDLAPAAGTSSWTYALGEQTTDTAFVMLNPITSFFVMIGQDGSALTDLIATLNGWMSLTNTYVDGALETPTTRDDMHTLMAGTHTVWQEFTVSSSATFNDINLFRYDASATFHFAGKIYSTILLERALTAGERTQLQAYIAGKAGL